MDTHYNTEVNTNKSICDGAGCSKKATIMIEEEVGDMGMIILQLCDDCITKFCRQ